jgi:hypothetical protein
MIGAAFAHQAAQDAAHESISPGLKNIDQTIARVRVNEHGTIQTVDETQVVTLDHDALRRLCRLISRDACNAHHG